MTHLADCGGDGPNLLRTVHIFMRLVKDHEFVELLAIRILNRGEYVKHDDKESHGLVPLNKFVSQVHYYEPARAQAAS